MKKFWHWLRVTLAASAVLAVLAAIAYAIYDHLSYSKFLDDDLEEDEDEDEDDSYNFDLEDEEDDEADAKDFDEAYYHSN